MNAVAASIEVERLKVTHRRGDFLLDIPSLQVSPGITGLIGVNGAGKTTLCRALVGGLRPQQGTIAVGGHDIYGPQRRAALTHIAMLEQEYCWPLDASVAELMRYAAWLRVVPPREAMERTERILTQVDLVDRMTTRASRLSGGMRRRLGLALALVGEPPVLVLDEPTTGLDPEQRASVRHLIDQLRDRYTIVMSSHVTEDIDQLADHVLALNDGRLVFDGPKDAFAKLDPTGEGSSEIAFLRLLTTLRGSS